MLLYYMKFSIAEELPQAKHSNLVARLVSLLTKSEVEFPSHRHSVKRHAQN